jgi:hypothetical protein
MKPYPGDIGSLIESLILETEGASSWRQREPHPGYRRSLILET